jgi:hypothetical protein
MEPQMTYIMVTIPEEEAEKKGPYGPPGFLALPSPINDGQQFSSFNNLIICFYSEWYGPRRGIIVVPPFPRHDEHDDEHIVPVRGGPMPQLSIGWNTLIFLGLSRVEVGWIVDMLKTHGELLKNPDYFGGPKRDWENYELSMNKLKVILEEVGNEAVETAVSEYVLGLLEGNLIGRTSATKDCERHCSNSRRRGGVASEVGASHEKDARRERRGPSREWISNLATAGVSARRRKRRTRRQ